MRKDIYITPELYEDFETLGDFLRTQDKALLDARGHELPNPEPLVLNMDMGQPMTLQEQIQRLFKQEISMQGMKQGMETEAEANDFNIPGDNLETWDDSKYTIMEEEYIEETLPPGPIDDVSSSKEEKIEPEVSEAETTETETSE